MLPTKKRLLLADSFKKKTSLLKTMLLLTGFCFLFSINLFAQTESLITVTGSVNDGTGKGIPQVTVTEKGSNNRVMAGNDGRFIIKVKNGSAVLTFTSVGYEPYEVPLANSITINVSLKRLIANLNEVVVVGYGTQNKNYVTTSIAKVRSEDFVKGAVTDVMQLIRGKVAGLAINTTNGDPNGGVQIMLRGVNTLSGNRSPLIIIDGIPGGSLATIAQDDIESIDVLKDGSAAAIYGTRGTNGVIIVTTKKGTGAKNGISIDYHGYAAYETISRKIDILSPQEFLALPKTTGGVFSAMTDLKSSNDWWDKISQNPVSHQNNLSVRGGNPQSNYVASINYRDQEGILLGSGKDQLTMRLGINHSTLNNRLRFSANVNNTATNSQDVDNQVYFFSRLANPTASVKDDNGKYRRFPEIVNPVQEITEKENGRKWNQFLLNTKISIEPVKNFNISAVAALQRYNSTRGIYANRNYQDGDAFNGQAWRNNDFNEQRTLEFIGDYTKKINQHDITLLTGYSYQDFTWEGNNMYNYNFPTDLFSVNQMNLGLALQQGTATMSSFKGNSKLIAFLGRVNYSFNEKYLLSASLRHEGSSKFGKNNKWGNFYAVSAGWRLIKEDFINDLGIFNDLKLRAGYGVTGTEPTDSYLSLESYQYGSPVLNNTGGWTYGIGPSRNPNPNLKWETKHELNIGLDWAMLQNKLSGTIDFYKRNTKDLLWAFNVPVPPNLAPTTFDNVGEISNSGIEVLLNAQVLQQKNFQWSVSGNFSYNTNKVVKLSNSTYKRDFIDVGWTAHPVQKNTHRVMEGDAVGNFFGWRSTGLNDDGTKWVTATKYGDLNAREVIGNGIPKMFAGFNTSIAYKGFDFSISLRGAFDYQILNQYRMLWETFVRGPQWNYPKTILDKPYGGKNYNKAEPAYVSYFVEDGDFVKIDNATLGYNFRFKNPNSIKSARVYIAGLNLHTFTDYKGVDPEVKFLGLDPGLDEWWVYPTTRSFTFSVQLGF